MEPDDRLEAAIDAALEAGAAAGHHDSRPVILQDTNNVVVWLAPHPIVAKVGVWPHSRHLLQRESELCAELAAIGAPVVPPIRDSGLRRDHGLRPGAGRFGHAQLPVSLWRQVNVNGPAPTAAGVAALLRRVHDDLALVDIGRLSGPLPTFVQSVRHAGDVLSLDEYTADVDPDDLAMLRECLDRWADRAEEWEGEEFVLHGDPHGDNVLSTSAGLVLIDFEAACLGPIEWDLASLAPGTAEAYGAHDRTRLELYRALKSAQLAAWCWSSPHASMRRQGDAFVAAVRAVVEHGT